METHVRCTGICSSVLMALAAASFLFRFTVVTSQTTARDYCIGNPCKNNGTCMNRDDRYECNCFGFMGKDCTDPNPCDFHDQCQNRGTCVVVNDTIAECWCRPGYTGIDCSININECEDDPCLNGGTCIDQINQYRCECAKGYKGGNCTEPDPCALYYCYNFGICIDTNGELYCNCSKGFTGKNCSIDIDDCIGDPCLNGATCIDGPNQYTCECAFGFSGDNCTVSDDNEDVGMQTGALVAIGIVVTVVVICAVLAGLWCYYIKVNPEGYGRTETIRRLGNVGEFIRRSFRLSKRRTRSDGGPKYQREKDEKNVDNVTSETSAHYEVPKDPEPYLESNSVKLTFDKPNNFADSRENTAYNQRQYVEQSGPPSYHVTKSQPRSQPRGPPDRYSEMDYPRPRADRPPRGEYDRSNSSSNQSHPRSPTRKYAAESEYPSRPSERYSRDGLQNEAFQADDFKEISI